MIREYKISSKWFFIGPLLKYRGLNTNTNCPFINKGTFLNTPHFVMHFRVHQGWRVGRELQETLEKLDPRA